MRALAALGVCLALGLLAPAAAQATCDPTNSYCNPGGSTNPCNDPSGVQKGGSGLAIGLAFYIGSQYDKGLLDWDPVQAVLDNTTNTTTNVTTSLSPCSNASNLNMTVAASVTAPDLSAYGISGSQVFLAAYYPKGDIMSSFTFDTTQLDQLAWQYTLLHASDTITTCTTVGGGSSTTPSGAACGTFGNPCSPPPPAQPSSTTEQTCTTAPANVTAQYITVVAYSGNVRSSPRVVRTNDTELTGTGGGGKATGQVSTLVLLGRFKNGALTQLVWESMGCSSCKNGAESCIYVGGDDTKKGSSAAACGAPWVGTSSTKEPVGGCSEYALKPGVGGKNSTNASQCSFNIYFGFSGTDASSRALKSGPQIELLRKYSVSNLASQAWSYARYAKNLGVSPTKAGGSQSGVGRRLLDAAAGGLQSFGALVGRPGALLRLAN